jgi:hypothetical protein
VSLKKKYSPILYLFYNRIEKIKLSFAVIKKIKPSKLYLASDGPKNNGDKIIVNNARDYVLKNIDWDCKVKKLFYKKNKSLKKGISNSITWFFNNEKSGIILEDDLLPDVSFFRYASELLKYYKTNKKIGMISGNNFVDRDFKDSYYFSKYASCWGWATWSDRWKSHYDVDMKKWKSKKFSFFNKNERFFIKIFNSVYTGKDKSWDYQWLFAMLNNNLLQITPKINLVSNIGFGDNATNTHSKHHWGANRRTSSINFPLVHPKATEANIFLDALYLNNFLFPSKNFFSFIYKTIKKIIYFFRHNL